MATKITLEDWKTVRIGTGLETADDFRRALKRGGYRFSEWASGILDKSAFTLPAEETKVDLVVVSVAELGFRGRATRADIYKRALEVGLELCPAEVGPQLRLQYKDQPRYEWLRIGMEPINDSGGSLSVFCVGRGGDVLWLDGDDGSPDSPWLCGHRWVFVRRK